jgi:diguanylate cyclase (GGDEF)-like protein
MGSKLSKTHSENPVRDSMESSAIFKTEASFTNYFLHPSLHQNPDILHRARALIITFWIGVSIIFINASLLVIAPIDLVFRISSLLLDLGLIGTIIYLLFQLKNTGNYDYCSKIAITIFLLSIVLATCITGGLSDSPFTQLLVASVLVAYFFRSKRGGNIATAFVATFSVLAILLEKSGFKFPQTLTPQQKDIAQGLLLLMQFGTVIILAFVYEYTSASLREERDLEYQKVMRLAQTDQLTGLLNRRTFDETIGERIAHYRMQNKSSSFALCCLDLDGFKPINDRHGHDVGDQVLRAISIRLRAALRGADIVSRHGGDEFLLLLDELGSGAAIQRNAKRFLKLISDPIETSAGLLSVSGSLGFALYPQHGADIETLKKAADAAMYSAKRNHLGWKIFDADLLASGS